jgi:hypothetical protein
MRNNKLGKIAFFIEFIKQEFKVPDADKIPPKTFSQSLIRFMSFPLIAFVIWGYIILNDSYRMVIGGEDGFVSRSVISDSIFLILMVFCYSLITKYLILLEHNKPHLFAPEKLLNNALSSLRNIVIPSVPWSILRQVRITLLFSVVIQSIMILSFAIVTSERDGLLMPNEYFGSIDFAINICYLFIIIDAILFLKTKPSENHSKISDANIIIFSLFGAFCYIIPWINDFNNIGYVRSILMLSILIIVPLAITIVIAKSMKISVKNLVSRHIILPFASMTIIFYSTMYMFSNTNLYKSLDQDNLIEVSVIKGKEFKFYDGYLSVTDNNVLESFKETIGEAYLGRTIHMFWRLHDKLIYVSSGKEDKIIGFISEITKHSNKVIFDNKDFYDSVDTKTLITKDAVKFKIFEIKYKLTDFDIENDLLNLAINKEYQKYLDLYLKEYLNNEKNPTVGLDVKTIAQIIILSKKGFLNTEDIADEKTRKSFIKQLDINKKYYLKNIDDKDKVADIIELSKAVDWYLSIN